LERVAPRSRKLFGAITARATRACGQESAGESSETSGRLPDERLIAIQLRRAQTGGRKRSPDVIWIARPTAVAAQLVARAREVLASLQGGGSDASISGDGAVVLEEALMRFGKPPIFNTDQGSLFTSMAFTGTLERAGIQISMDGRGRWIDKVFIERL
jgi:putative transposase